MGWAETIIGQNPPYQENFTINNTRLDNPAGSALNPPSAAAVTIRGMDTDWKTPYMQHWSLDFQHQVSSDLMFTLGYYGSKGTHLVGVTEINDLPPGLALNSFCAPGNNTTTTAGVTLVRCQPAVTHFVTAPQSRPRREIPMVGTTLFTDNAILDQLRPYRGYRSITMLQPRYNSNYHSLQFFMQKRFTGASEVSVAYTLSKNLTDSQNDRSMLRKTRMPSRVQSRDARPPSCFR